MIAYTAVFIGHRDYDRSLDDRLEHTLILLIRHGYTRFLSGGMGEFDAACEDCILRLKARYPHIRLCLAVNAPTHHADPNRYDEIVTPDMLKPGLGSVSIPIRNKLMVQSASAAICYVKRFSGGAYTSYKAALKNALLIFHI